MIVALPRPSSIWTSFGVLLSLVVAGGVVTLGLVLASAAWASRESDLAALEHQRQVVNSRLNSQIDSVADELVHIAGGYASAIQEMADNGEPDLVAGNKFTRIVTAIFKYDEAFIVWSDGRLAFQSDEEMAQRYNWVKPLVLPMLRAAVAVAAGTSAGSGDLPSESQIVELRRLQGRPSIAGVVAIPRPIGRDLGEQGLFLIAYRYLDGPALDALSREQGLSGARYARSSDPEPNEVTFQIEETVTKEPIGFIVWTPELPGSRVVVGLMPALAMAAMIVAGLVVGLVLLLRKSWADLRDSEQKAQHRSLHDILTDLPNRGMFALRLQDHLDGKHEGESAVVALVDLDRFKAVNDTFGHAAGDEVIRAVAGRITGLLGEGDLLARLGGDEFALLLCGTNRRSAAPLELCQRIIADLSVPFRVLDDSVIARIGCSIGLVTVSPRTPSVSGLLRMADLALYEAKSSGRGRCVEYTPAMDLSAKHRDELKADLSAFLNDVGMLDDDADRQLAQAGMPREYGVEVFFQTIHRAGREAVISGAEALVRWRHPKLGLLTPDRFISIAEDSGLIGPLGRFVLLRACIAAKSWPHDVKLSVNVSPSQLRTPHFAREVFSVLEKTGLLPSRLEIEVTETALMGGDEHDVEAELISLRKQGVKIALDDFGTGFSSLSHLIQFGIDRLKIDRSFVQLLGRRSDGAAVVSAVVALGHSLGLATTAEGVETAGQRDFLVAAGCTDLQGYLFARPVAAPDLEPKQWWEPEGLPYPIEKKNSAKQA